MACLVERLNHTVDAKQICGRQSTRLGYIWMPTVLRAYRASKQRSTELSPYQLMFGCQPRLPADAALGLNSEKQVQFSTEFANELERSHQLAREVVEETLAMAEQRKVKNEHSATPYEYRVGAYVWLYQPSLKTGLSKKLEKPFTGPFQVKMVFDNAT